MQIKINGIYCVVFLTDYHGGIVSIAEKLWHFHQNLLQSYCNDVMSLNTINSDSGTDLCLPYPVNKHITVRNHILSVRKKVALTVTSSIGRQHKHFLLAYLLRNYTNFTRQVELFYPV